VVKLLLFAYQENAGQAGDMGMELLKRQVRIQK
jgi:hypothetical protein